LSVLGSAGSFAGVLAWRVLTDVLLCWVVDCLWCGLAYRRVEELRTGFMVGSPGSSLVLLCRLGMAPPSFLEISLPASEFCL
jgi:hypothetical protein